MLELTGPQKRKLRDALVAAFVTMRELARLSLDRLDLNLNTITGDTGTEDAAYDLIQWASGRGLLADLIAAARNERPAHELVKGLADLGALTSQTDTGLQKFVSDNVIQLNPAAFREGQARAERRVCRIDRGVDGVGTGFLVGPDLVLTNYHVVKSLLAHPGDRSRWSARFDHKVTADGKDLIAGVAIDFAEDWDVDHSPHSTWDTKPDPKGGDPTNEELDYALIRLAKSPGDDEVGKTGSDEKGWEAEERGWVALRTTPVTFAQHRMVAILQHPMAKPMKLSLGMEEKLTLNAPGNRLRHRVPTEPGSSGSPVFDQDWNLIALHHSGDPKEIKPEYNEAIPIALIAARPEVAAALPK